MPLFRKKPVVIEAHRLTCTNARDIAEWCGGEAFPDVVRARDPWVALIAVRTPEGLAAAVSGDWIIKGERGEFYPCKPDIFDATYERESE